MTIGIVHRQTLNVGGIVQTVVGRKKGHSPFTRFRQPVIDGNRRGQMHRIVPTQWMSLNERASALDDGLTQRHKPVECVTMLGKQIVHPGVLVRRHRPFVQPPRKSTPHLDAQQM